ncbi:MAG: hypothetical protein JRE64_24720 [Deltaproteobacteria bacterium]|nr:hypothetical protein [Deltaproteobacteria bacterium]
MIISRGGRYTGPKEVKYLFIDGGYLLNNNCHNIVDKKNCHDIVDKKLYK